MVDDIDEGLKTNATLSNVSVEQSDANDDVRQLTELSHLLRGGQTDKWSETGSWEHRLEGGGHLSFNGVGDGGSQLDGAVVADDVLLVLVEQVVEDLLVEDGDALEVIAASRLERDDLVDESVGLVGQVGDVLLSLDFLLNIGRIVTDL